MGQAMGNRPTGCFSPPSRAEPAIRLPSRTRLRTTGTVPSSRCWTPITSARSTSVPATPAPLGKLPNPATAAALHSCAGSGVLTVQSGTNHIDNLINGVTLNRQAADASKPVTITVANDTSQAQKAITNFVKTYNDLTSTINQQTTYDQET